MSARIDITGQIFNGLTALSQVAAQKWLFRCTCGTVKSIDRQNVQRGAVKSCGCSRRESAPIEAGNVFSHLTAIRKAENSKNGKTQWEFACSCGTVKSLEAAKVTTGRLNSCGCLRGQSYFDITGERYGMLTATAYVERGTRGARWRFTCDCGSSIVATAKDIRYGGRTDCGCQAEQGSVVRADLKRRMPTAAPQGDVFAGFSAEQLARLADALGIYGDAASMVTFARAIAARHAAGKCSDITLPSGI
jgi:hypothetical protein